MTARDPAGPRATTMIDHLAERPGPGGALLLCLALTCLPGGCSAGSNRGALDGRASLSIEAIDLGDVKAGDSREFSCEYSGGTAGRVDFGEITASCPCLTVVPSRSSPGGGGSAALKFRLDTKEEPDFRGRLHVAVEGKSPSGALNFRTHVDLNVVD